MSMINGAVTAQNRVLQISWPKCLGARLSNRARFPSRQFRANPESRECLLVVAFLP